MTTRTTTVLTVAGVTVVTVIVAYAAYFDYKRRNDVNFRKKLRKDKKKVDKSKAQGSPAASASSGVSHEDLREALERLRQEDVPASAEDREQYFMTQVSMAEQLSAQGPIFYLPAALHFYRALRVYPSPVELIVIYQKTVPEPVFKLVMEMTNMDVQGRIEGYYKHFPAKSLNVAVMEAPDDVGVDGKPVVRKRLVATKDFKAGDVIYQEHALVAVLDADLQGKGTHCSHCLRSVKKGMALEAEEDPLGSVYCSKDCQLKAKLQHHNLLFGSEALIPGEVPVEVGASPEDRAAAQRALVGYLAEGAEKGKNGALLTARFICRQIAIETSKALQAVGGMAGPYSTELPETHSKEGTEYGLWDHVERLRYLDVNISTEENEMVREVLKCALPGLEQFLVEDKHAELKGKMLYNAIGVCFPGSANFPLSESGEWVTADAESEAASSPVSDVASVAGRDDKPESNERPEDMERTRTPYGTSRQTGCGFYPVSSYLNHSCDPSARPSFRSGTSELYLIANRDLQAGDELTMAYVDVTQHAGESVEEARRRRRVELARGWRFPCKCARCLADGAPAVSEVSVTQDESKVEESVNKFERRG